MITLRAGNALAELSPDGAELLAWRAAGLDLLWHRDPAWWDGTAPVLFPVCGWLNGGVIHVGGQAYALGLHGFAYRSRFTVVEAGADTAVLHLQDSAATRAVYPYAFRLEVRYALTADTVSVAFAVHNTGDEVLPYSLGLHPGFRWPLAEGERAGHALRFARAERPEVPIHENGLITGRTRAVPFRGTELPLDDALFEPGGLNMRAARSRRVAYCAPGGASVELAFDNLPNIVVWTRPGAPFLCVEGWQGTNDPAGFTGDVIDKPGMALLPPGGVGRHAVMMRVRPAR